MYYGYKKKEASGLESQPAIEQEALKKVFKIIGTKKQVIIIADRGFDGVQTLKYIENYGHSYVIRATTESKIAFSNGETRTLTFDIVNKGEKKLFQNIRYTNRDPFKTNLAAVWNKKQVEPWLLLSNLKHYSAEGIAQLYCMRWEIETMFKSMKNDVLGMQIKFAKLRHIERWLRYLFLVTVLFQFLAMIGISFRKHEGIEKRYSMSSKVPPRQRYIFSFYNLALHIIGDYSMSLRYRQNNLFFKQQGFGWIAL